MATKKTCELKNMNTGFRREIDCDFGQSLYNNLRIWVLHHEEDMQEFLSPEVIELVKREKPLESDGILVEIEYEDSIIDEIDINAPLLDQLEAEEDEDCVIALDCGGYIPDAGELPVWSRNAAKKKRKVKENYDKDQEEIVISDQVSSDCKSNGDSRKKEDFSDKVTRENVDIKETGNRKGTGDKACEGGKSDPEGGKHPGSGSVLITLGIVLAVLVIAAVGGTKYLNDPVRNMKKNLKEGLYSECVTLYNEKIYESEKDKKKADPVIEEKLNSLYNDYQSGSEYTEITDAVSAFCSLYDTTLKNEADLVYMKIVQDEEAKGIIEDAEAAYKEGDYLGAAASYARVGEKSQYKAQSEERFEACVSELLKQVSAPVAPEDYESVIAQLDNWYNDLSDEKFAELRDQYTEEYNTLVENNARNDILQTAKESWDKGDYKAAFETLKEAVAEKADAIISSKITDYEKQFETLITEKVEGLMNEKKFSEAAAQITQAIETYSCEAFITLQNTVAAAKKESLKVYTAESAEILDKPGTIENEESVNTFSFEAPRTGNYSFETYEMMEGFEVNLVVQNSLGKPLIDTGMCNESVTDYTLEEGENYTVQVKSRYNTGSYELKIGQPKESEDLAEYSMVQDSIEYYHQVNTYTFTPEITGYYRFDFTEVMYGMDFLVDVTNRLGRSDGDYVCGYESGITKKLNAGEEYKITVTQRNDYGNYNMKIGRQNAVSDKINVGECVYGSMDFIEQRNYLNFTAAKNCRMALTVSEMMADCGIYVSVVNNLDAPAGDGYMRNDSELVFDVEAGKSYKIELKQDGKLCSYGITLTEKVED